MVLEWGKTFKDVFFLHDDPMSLDHKLSNQVVANSPYHQSDGRSECNPVVAN